MSNKYNINYLPIARKDLIDIIEYIQEDNPNTTINFINKIEDTISKLEDFQYMGTTPKDTLLHYKGYRILVIQSYLIFYVVKKNTLEVEIRGSFMENENITFYFKSLWDLFFLILYPGSIS